MFGDNLKLIRKRKGMTQEELAIRLNVVRQTVSKWEKGLSVPDADLLIKLADVLEVKVAELLGANSVDDENKNEIAEHLARISEQLAIKNRRSRIVWKVLAGLGILFLVINFSLVIIGIISHNSYSEDIEIQQLPISEESQIYENNP